VSYDTPRGETVPGPIVREQLEPRWFGVPARFVLLCLGCAAVGAACGLFAASAWGWGFAALLLAFIAFGALREAVRQTGRLLPERSILLAVDGRSHAVATAQVWRTRVETSLTHWRTRARLHEVERERGRRSRSSAWPSAAAIGVLQTRPRSASMSLTSESGA